jgi:hypothetical protein
MPNVAKFNVRKDDWGYRAEPKRRDLIFNGSDMPVIQVKNNLGAETIEINVDRAVVNVLKDSGNTASPGGVAELELDMTDRPANSFDVYIDVVGTGLRARAHSDPRVRPK